MPGHIAPLVGGDGALDVGAGQHGDERINSVGADGFLDIRFDVARVLLGAHFEIGEEIAQGNRIGQVVPQLGRRGGIRGNGGKTNQFPGHACGKRVGAVNAVLHKQFGHHQPTGFGGGVGIMGAVNLEDIRRCHDALGFRRIHKGAVHVDVAVQHVVLRVLVGAVHAFLGEQHCHFGTSHTGHIAVEVDRATHFLFD